MDARKFRVEFRSLFRILFGHGSKILAQQHACGKQIRRRGIGGHTKHSRKSSTSVRVILGLQVTNTKDVRGIYVGARIPSLYFFERGDRFCRTSREVIRKPHQLYRFVVAGIFLQRFLKACRSLQVIAFPVVGNTDLAHYPSPRRLRGGNALQQRERLIVFSLLHQKRGSRQAGILRCRRCALRKPIFFGRDLRSRQAYRQRAAQRQSASQQTMRIKSKQRHVVLPGNNYNTLSAKKRGSPPWRTPRRGGWGVLVLVRKRNAVQTSGAASTCCFRCW